MNTPPYPNPPQANGLATASLILGLCGLLTCGITSLVGLILGIIGLSQINSSQGQQTGKGLAIGGIISSGVLMLIGPMLLLSLIVIPRMVSAGQKAKEATLKANLQQLRNAIGQFEADTGVYPVTLTDLTVPNENKLQTPFIPKNSYKGPYLVTGGGLKGTGIPGNPFASPGDTDITHHWVYSEGQVLSAIGGVTTDGVQYTEL